MKSFPKTLHPIAAAVMSLTLAMPAAAVPQGATLSFTPGSGNKPVVRTERGDFQAGQRFSTGANEVRELIFPDGLSVTLAPNSELVIESLPSAGSGAVLRVNRGLVRVAGGAGNDTQPVIVQTPAERITLNAASAVIQVGEGGRTRANLLVGRGLAMSRAAADQGVQRPGFALEVADSQSTPLGPSRLGEEVFASDTLLLSTSQLTGGTEDGSGPLLVAAINTSQMTGNRFAEASENQPAGQPAGQQSSGGGAAPPPINGGGGVPLPIAGFVDLSVGSQGGVAGGGFGVGGGVPAPVLSPAQPSEANGDARNLAQTRGNATGNASTSDFLEPSRQAGPTVSRLFNSSDQYSQVLGATRPTTLLDLPTSQIDPRLQYVFRNDGGPGGPVGLQLDSFSRDLCCHVYTPGGGSFDSNAPLIMNSLPGGWPAAGRLGPTFTLIDNLDRFEGNRLGGAGSGHMFEDVARVSILQGGFAPNGNVMVRSQDNFLMLQLAPGRVDRRARDELRSTFSDPLGNVSDPIGFANKFEALRGFHFQQFGITTTAQVDTVAETVLSGLASLTVTNADRVTTGLASPYLTTITPLLDALATLGAGNSSVQAAADEVSRGLRFGSADFTALRALNIAGGRVNDPIAFLQATGRAFSLDYSFAQLNDFINLVVGPGSPALQGSALQASDLSPFGFLNDGERQDILATANRILSGVEDPTRSERFLFAAGNVDAGRINADGSVNVTFANQLSVDRFFLSAGLEKFADKDVAGTTVASNIRAFLRRDSSVGTAVADGGLFVVNTGSSAPDAQNGLLHADFGMNGSGGGQRSTISATIGNLSYRLSTQPGLDIENSYAVDVNARTLGSSRSAAAGTVAINSPLTSTAAGGGNPSLARDGYAGYLLLENYVPEDTTNFGGGVEHALGTAPSADQRYALLRLATATGSVDLSSITRTTRELTGWAGGLAEREIPRSSTLDVVPVGTGTDPGNLSIRTNADTNRVQASLALNGGAVLSLGGLGASSSPSAFVDDKRFGAANAQTALISADVLRNASGNLPPALSSIPNYSHLQWGFFFGDVSAASGPRDHLHLGTWVSGLAASQLPTTGEATYIGHAIGNVTAGGAPYTAVGTYQNSWNFAQRSGSVSLGFDGAQYSGTTRLQANNVVFDGALTGVPNRSGGVVGNFMRSSAGDGGGAPAAMGGRFVISETQGTTYRASGTFGAERQP